MALAHSPELEATIVAGRPMPVFRRIGVEPLTGACGADCRRQKRFLPTQFEGSPTVFHSAVIEAEVGGAMIFVLDVERFERI